MNVYEIIKVVGLGVKEYPSEDHSTGLHYDVRIRRLNTKTNFPKKVAKANRIMNAGCITYTVSMKKKAA